MKHLWDCNHAYYCNQGNYFTAAGQTENTFQSWGEFVRDEGDCDFDYNLLFRWDWKLPEGDAGEPVLHPDKHYRDGHLLLFWMCQRKGLYRHTIVSVCQADEPAVIEWLKPRLKHLMSLWEPLTQSN